MDGMARNSRAWVCFACDVVVCLYVQATGLFKNQNTRGKLIEVFI
jgi:hypothetical protein